MGEKSVIFLLIISSSAVPRTGAHDVAEVTSRRASLGEVHDRQCRQGDIIIGAALAIHQKDSYGECGSEMTGYGVQSVETINMIIDKVNNNESLLPGLTLGSVIIDTCFNDLHALKEVVSEILPFFMDTGREPCTAALRKHDHTKPIFAGLVGAVSSEVSIALAKLLQVFSIPQVSHFSTSPELSDKTRYKNFFRTVPPDSYQAPAMITLVKSMGWNYISVVYDDNAYGISGFAEIRSHAENSSICIASSRAIPTGATDTDYREVATELLKHKRAKAVIIFAMTSTASHVISATQSLSLKNHSIIWIGSDGWTKFLPRQESNESLLQSLDGAVGFTPRVKHVAELDGYMTSIDLKDRLKENSTIDPWWAKYLSSKSNCSLEADDDTGLRRCSGDERLDPNTFRSFDAMQNIANAMMTFVYALHDYHYDKCGDEGGLCKKMSKLPESNALASELYFYMENITFPSINGEAFRFDENQDGPHEYDVFIFRKPSHNSTGARGWHHAGIYVDGGIQWSENVYDKVRQTTSICSEPCAPGEARIQGNEVCCWHCHKCPDGEYGSAITGFCEKCPRGERVNQIRDGCESLPISEMKDETFYAVFSITLGALGICCTAVITGIFIKFRKTPIVKASGKELCFFVLFGVFATFTNFLPLTSHPTNFSCAASRVLMCIGPTWMYAGLLTKTLRIVIIFRAKTSLSKNIRLLLRPVPQLCFASCLVLVQIFVCAGWIMGAPSRPEILYPTEEVAFLACPKLLGIGILFGIAYPFLLIIVCTVLATVNRSVPTGFNETMLIGFTMYATCIIWLAFISIYFTNSTNLAQKLMTVSVSLSLSAVTVLCCLFLPRCYIVLFKPSKNTATSMMGRPSRVIYFGDRAADMPPSSLTNPLGICSCGKSRMKTTETTEIGSRTVSAKVRFQG